MEEEKKVKKPKSKTRKTVEWILTGLFLVLFVFLAAAQIDGMVNKNKHYGQQIRFGFATFVVETDSMVPAYPVKNAIITYLDDADKIYDEFVKNQGTEKTLDVTFFDGYDTVNEYTKPQNHPELTSRTPRTRVPMTHRVQEIHRNESVKKGKGRYTFITAGINTKSTNMGWSEGDPEMTIYQYQAFTEVELLGKVVVGSAFLGGVFGFISSIWGLLILLLIPAFYLVITSVMDIFKAYKEPEEEVAASSKEESSGSKGSIELSEEDKKRLKEELLQEMLDKKKGGN